MFGLAYDPVYSDKEHSTELFTYLPLGLQRSTMANGVCQNLTVLGLSKSGLCIIPPHSLAGMLSEPSWSLSEFCGIIFVLKCDSLSESYFFPGHAYWLESKQLQFSHCFKLL